jgi:glycosyltransferase involved in cell wall biosynthesis
MRHLVADWQPHLLYERYALFGLVGQALGAELEIPHLLEVNAPLRLERQGGPGVALEGPARWAERRIFGSANRVLCVSKAMATYVMQHGAQPKHVLIQPNAVDAGKFSPDDRALDVRSRLGFAEAHVVVGFVGSLKPWHGVELLVHAFVQALERVPTLRLLLVGDGPMRAPVERLVRTCNVESTVVMVGNVPHAEVPRYMAAIDIAVAPYLPTTTGADFYFSPLKILEYMAAGRPIIASRLGQVRDLLCGGAAGLLCTPGQEEALVQGLVSLAEQPVLRTTLAARATEEVRARYTWQATAQRVVTLSDEVAHEMRHSTRRRMGVIGH